MCLITREREKTSPQDIICYKVVRKAKLFYYSPFFNKRMHLRIRMKAHNYGKRDERDNVEGGFHMFVNLKDAQEICDGFKKEYPKRKYKVLLAVIPKNVSFYHGDCVIEYRKFESYCSREVIYRKQ